MIDLATRKKLESLTQLPVIPYVISEILNVVDNTDISASSLAALIEKDQALTARVLRVANSPLYGFARRISTIDLAVVILGLNTIKEIVLSLILRRFYFSINRNLFDIDAFWQYTVFCGSACRALARRLGYKLTGEAFVAGLMHDVGILVIVEYFSREYAQIRTLMQLQGFSLTEAEQIIIKSNHCDIGFWLAEKWNLPSKICATIKNHHSKYLTYKKDLEADRKRRNLPQSNEDESDNELLIAIVALSEWFAKEMGFVNWMPTQNLPTLFLADSFIDDLRQDDMLAPDSALEVIKQDIMDEFNKSSIISEAILKPS